MEKHTVTFNNLLKKQIISVLPTCNMRRENKEGSHFFPFWLFPFLIKTESYIEQAVWSESVSQILLVSHPECLAYIKDNGKIRVSKNKSPKNANTKST